MAAAGSKIKDYPVLTAPTSNTKLVVSHNGNTYQMNICSMFANNTGNVSFSNSSTLSANSFLVRRDDTPANSTITVTKGAIWSDGTYLYVATADNTLKRIALTAF